MPRTASPLPADLASAACRFEEWRDRRTRRTIPPELWSLAAELATRHGVSRTARALRVHYADLKERVRVTSSHDGPGAVETGSSFVEILTSVSSLSGEISVEMDHPRGAQMRVRLPSAERAVVVELCHLFLGVGE